MPKKTAPRTFKQLEATVEAVRIPSKRLAVAVGNFHGANDFAKEGREMWSGFVLEELLHELTASLVVRTNALLETPKFPNDMTLAGAADLLEIPEIRAEATERAKGWSFPNEDIARVRAHNVPDRTKAFLQIVRRLDVKKLRDYRNWVLAHNTVNPRPPLTYIEVWEIAEATLLASDYLRYVVTGDYDDVVGIAKNRREQSDWFWRRLNVPEDGEELPLEGQSSP